jgi:hypothetical protein
MPSYIGYERKDFKMQKKGSNWKFLVGAAAGAFVAYRSLKNSKPPIELGKPNDVNLAAPQILDNPKQEQGASAGINLSVAPKNKMEYYFGYLPVKTFITALAVAFILKYIDLGMMVKFRGDNYSIDNVYTAMTSSAWLLIIFTPILFLFRKNGFARWVRCVLSTGMTFFFDVAFFSSAFILANVLPTSKNSVRDACLVAFILLASVLLNHLLLILMRKDVSTLKLVKRVDKYFKTERAPLNAQWVFAIAVISFLCISYYFSEHGIPFASYFA